MMEQLEMPFPLDLDALQTFLTRWITIEDEEERLREEKRLLKTDYQNILPMRAVLTGVKVVRARKKLVDHPQEPMAYRDQGILEAMVLAHLARMDVEKGHIPDMTLAGS